MLAMSCQVGCSAQAPTPASAQVDKPFRLSVAPKKANFKSLGSLALGRLLSDDSSMSLGLCMQILVGLLPASAIHPGRSRPASISNISQYVFATFGLGADRLSTARNHFAAPSNGEQL